MIAAVAELKCIGVCNGCCVQAQNDQKPKWINRFCDEEHVDIGR